MLNDLQFSYGSAVQLTCCNFYLYVLSHSIRTQKASVTRISTSFLLHTDCFSRVRLCTWCTLLLHWNVPNPTYMFHLGTPVQNSPKELMSLLCFLMPLFDSKTKSSKGGFDSDDEKGGDGGERMLEHFVHLEAAEGGDAAAYQKLKQLFAPFVLRRKKSDVLSQIMPPKTRKVDLVDMDESTNSVYNTILSNALKGGADTGKTNELLKSFKSLSAQKHLFTELRKAANHPLLLRTRHLDIHEIDDLSRRMLNYHYFGSDSTCTLQLVKNQLEKLSDYDIHCAALTMIEENEARREYLEKYTLVENDIFCSPKFVRLRSLLPELVKKGHRILLFSQWSESTVCIVIT